MGDSISDMFKRSEGEASKFEQEVSNGLAGMAVQLTSFSEFWNSLWRSMAFTIIKEVVQEALTQMIVKLTAIKALTRTIFGGPLAGIASFLGFHEGGVVETAHQGKFIKAHRGLAVDEVPIIAQTGEGILSRRGMNALGGEGALNALNGGQSAGAGGGVINLEVNINNPRISSRESVKELSSLLGEEIQRNLRYARGV